VPNVFDNQRRRERFSRWMHHSPTRTTTPLEALWSPHLLTVENDLWGIVEQLGLDALAYAETQRRRMPTLDAVATTFACADGCASCCELPVLVTLPEVVVAIAFAGAPTKTISGRHTDILRGLDTTLRKTHDAYQAITPATIDTLRTPCPLLNDGSCSIYDARPLPCRGWHSLDVAPCKDHNIRRSPTPDIPQHLPYRLLFTSAQRALAIGLQKRGFQPMVYLAQGLSILMSPARDGALERWQAGGSIV
jgi:Fe-S-cluster containining protein